MLHFLRAHKRSKVINAAFLVIILVFIFWGVGGFMSDEGPTAGLATVDGQPIGERAFQRAYRDLVQRYREAYKERFNPELLKSLELRQRTLEGLIDHQVLIGEAQRLGLEVGDHEVRDALLAAPAFQVEGRFSKDAYLRALRYSNFTPAEYENLLRSDLAQKRLRSLIDDGIKVSDAEVLDEILLNAEKVTLWFVRFRASEHTAGVQVADEELTKYFDAHKGSYQEPERVKIEYISYPVAKFEEGITPSDEDVGDFYELRKEDRFTQQHEVHARHILIKLAAGADDAARQEARRKIDDLAAKIAAGKDFAALAREHSQDEGTAKSGGDLGFFGRGRMVKPFEDIAFDLKPGETSKVVESPFGLHLIQVEEVREERVKSLDEVRADIVTTLKGERASEAAKQAVEQDRTAMLAGKSIDEVASVRGLTVERPSPVARNDSIPGLGRAFNLMNAVFGLAPEGLTEPLQAGGAWVVARLKEKIPVAAPELAKVRERVESAYRLERGKELARAAAEKLLEEAKTAGSLDAPAKAAKRTVEESGSFARAGGFVPKIGASQPLKDAAFGLTEAAKVARQVFEVAGDAFVVALKERSTPGEDEIAKQKDETMKSLLERRRQAAFAEFLKQLKANARIQVNRERVEQVPAA